MFKPIEEIEFILSCLASKLSVEEPFYEFSEELREEGIRAEYDPSGMVIMTTEPENLVLALHEFAHHVYDEENEDQEEDMHGNGFRFICGSIVYMMKVCFGIELTISDIVDVPFGEEFIEV
jgi:hypothetical protein